MSDYLSLGSEDEKIIEILGFRIKNRKLSLDITDKDKKLLAKEGFDPI